VGKVFGRLALIALFIFAGVTIWYGRVEKKLQGSISVEKIEPAALPAQKPSETAPVEYSTIVARNIFKALPESGGKPTGEQSQQDLEDLAETKMQLALLGTVTGSKEDARAIIRDEKAKAEDIYHVGSELHGALITRIGRGKVVLQVNGREEILTIKEPESGGPPSGSSPTAGNPMSQMQTAPVSERRVPEAVPRRRISFRNAASAVPPPVPVASTAEGTDDVEALSPSKEKGNQMDNKSLPEDKPVPESELSPPESGAAESTDRQAQ